MSFSTSYHKKSNYSKNLLIFDLLLFFSVSLADILESLKKCGRHLQAGLAQNGAGDRISNGFLSGTTDHKLQEKYKFSDFTHYK